MLERTKTPPTNAVTLSFTVPAPLEAEVRSFMQQKGIAESKEYYTIEEVLPYTNDEKPRVFLRGARYRENLTQAQLAQKADIPTRHISEMENGKRPIGKQNARKLAAALNVDPRLFISL